MYRSTISGFTLFVSLFIGTGFIAGSIVHFGEGVTIWDSSVLTLGILLFVVASYIQDSRNSKETKTFSQFVLFIVQSLLLAIGIGMASGGTQHFIDTPAYSAILIPMGLFIGFYAFLWREKAVVSLKKFAVLLPTSIALAAVLWLGLVEFNKLLPESLRVGHGSHAGHHEPVDAPEQDSHSH